MNHAIQKGKEGLLRQRARVSVDRAHGGGSRERTAEIDPSKTDGRDRTVHDRLTGDGDDDVSDDVTTGGGGSAARTRTLAGERRRFGTNGGHQRVEGDATNSPVTKEAAKEQRTAPATRKSGGGLRVDGDGGAPAVFGGGEGADEDSGDLATTMATFPSDGDS
uniref:DUF834 domain-containing protein n=2 Tax=Oryza sativa subsp. japonica TaxID=39947 RepID=A0A5S6R6V6_ORYSJ|nr:Unknown protein [Oryza sativa]AAM08712.1 Unknown protein [Oryza sativa Japonica Group]AAP51901.1 retrotransposon protein, putative, unclassified [Oryza sativa Japonica Group]